MFVHRIVSSTVLRYVGVLPSVVFNGVLIRRLRSLVQRYVNYARSSVQLFNLRVFYISNRGFLVNIEVRVLATYRFRRASRVKIQDNGSVASQGSRRSRRLQVILTFIFLLVIVVGLNGFLRGLVYLVLPIRSLARLLGKAMRAQCASRIWRYPIEASNFVLQLRIALWKCQTWSPIQFWK